MELSVHSVGHDEKLARFLFKGHFRPSDNKIKHSAFLPPAANKELSVYRISGLNEDDIWHIGDENVATARGKPVLGRADFLAEDVNSIGLIVSPAEPPTRHANIKGFPSEPDAILLKAKVLAETATFHPKPNS